jgi:hypothetical protein
MGEVDGAILVVHPDRKVQRSLGRVVGSLGRSLVCAGDAQTAAALLDDGTPALVLVGTAVRLDPASDPLVDRALAGGCRGCIVIHDDRAEVPRALFDVGAFHHLVTAPTPVLAEELFVTAQKLLRCELFGVDKYLAWGAVLGETELAATDDRVRALAQLGRDVERMQIGRRQQAAALLAADELVLNAIHDAPIDDAGVRYLRQVGRDGDRPLVGRERPRLRWGCDGRWFAVSVLDHFGSVSAPVVVEYLAKAVERRGQVRTDGPGAGIGLAMTLSAVTQLVFDVAPGRATEAIALVDVRPWPAGSMPPLGSFHLFVG